jgi:hypothetical protein
MSASNPAREPNGHGSANSGNIAADRWQIGHADAPTAAGSLPRATVLYDFGAVEAVDLPVRAGQTVEIIDQPPGGMSISTLPTNPFEHL